MFNWSWKLRSQRDYLSPVGPNFDWAPTQHLYLNDTHISIKLPRQRTQLPVENITLKGSWDLDALDYKFYESNGVRRRSVAVLKREWDFYGDWFTGNRGGISMTANIITPMDVPEGLNYFHPRALEAGIADQLTSWYGDDFYGDNPQQTWHAPMHWRQCDNFPCLAARFEAVNTVVKSDGPDYYLFMPLTKTHFLMLRCRISRNTVFSDKKPEPTVNEWIDLAPFVKLVNQVLDSVQVTLSPQAQSDQEEALRDLAEKSLVKEYPPIKWTAPPAVMDENWRDNFNG